MNCKNIAFIISKLINIISELINKIQIALEKKTKTLILSI